MRTKLMLSTAAVALVLTAPAAFAQSNSDKKPEATKEQTQAKPADQNKHSVRKADENKAAASSQNQSERKSSQAQSEQPKQQHSASDSRDREQRNSENKAAQQKAKDQNAQKQNAQKQNTQKQNVERNAKENNEQHNKAATTKSRSTTGQSTSDEQKSSDQQKNANRNRPQNSPSSAQQNDAQQNNTARQSTTQGPADNDTNTANTRNATQQKTANVNGQQLPPEKRTRISETISRSHDIAPPVRDLHVSINVGTRVPERVHLRRVPSEIVSIEPAYREYDYFTTEQDIVIVNPHSRQVVSMIPRDASRARAEVGSSSTQMSSTSGAGMSASSTTGGMSSSQPCQVMRREASGQTVPVNPEDLSRSTTGSGANDRNQLAVTVQAPNGQSMPPIALPDQTGQIVVATEGGDCKITIEPGAH